MNKSLSLLLAVGALALSSYGGDKILLTYIRSIESSNSRITISFVPLAFRFKVILNGTEQGYASHKQQIILLDGDKLELVGDTSRFTIVPVFKNDQNGISVGERDNQVTEKEAIFYFIQANKNSV